MTSPSPAPRFNLIDEPWIPCMRSADAPPTLLNLREVFAQAPQLWQIADPSPVVTISLYRLLLAILHRSLRGPRNAAEWARIYERGSWDTDAIHGYLTTWRARFDLFDAQRPFYQTPNLLITDSTGSASALAHERASTRNEAVMFDHTTSEDASLTPSAAARALLAQQNFAVSGLYSDHHVNGSASRAPLLGAAVCLVRGPSLFETLMLNWVRYSPSDGQPFPFHGDDQPAWERDEPTAPVERIPVGYVDLLTWQSRRILLLPATAPDGQVIVDRAVLMKGYQVSPSFDRWTAETMLTFRKSAGASTSGGEPWYPLSLQTDRVVWRDSHSLLQSVSDASERPKTLGWLTNLMLQDFLDERRTVPLDVYGMITHKKNQANIEDWRRETLPLPLAVLNDNALLEAIGQAVTIAESVARLLMPGAVKFTDNGKPITTGSPVSLLAEALLVGTSGRSPDRRAREDLANSFGAPLRYWAQLDTPFRHFVVSLPADVTVDAYGQRHYGRAALTEWTYQLEGVVRSVFQQITADLETSARALRAVSLAQSRFTFCLAALLAPWRPAAVVAAASATSQPGETPPGETPGETRS